MTFNILLDLAKYFFECRDIGRGRDTNSSFVSVRNAYCPLVSHNDVVQDVDVDEDDDEGEKERQRCTFWRSCTKCTMEWVFLARAVFLLSFICFFHCVMRRTRRSFHPTARDRLLLPLEFLIRAVSFDGSRAARSYDSPIRRIATVATILISFPGE